MNGEGILLTAIPVVVFIATLFTTFWLGKAHNKVGLISLAVLWAGFTGAMFFGMENATGWDGLGYLVALLGVSGPSGVGALIGGLVGWAKNEEAMHA